jgi:transcriptional antiterminator RfaH
MQQRVEFDPGDANAWLVVATHPHKEIQAIEHLGRQDYVSYCPMLRKRIRHARKVSDVLRPMFPGYVFVRHDDGRSVRPIASTVGVRAFVRSGSGPAHLPPGFVEGLRLREVGGAVVRPAGQFRPGQTVRMAGGAFDGLLATIISMDERDRLTVLMQLLNRAVRIKVDALGVTAT